MSEFFSWFSGLMALVIPGFGDAPPPGWDGYVEADYLYVGPTTAGAITSFAVEAGQIVRKGDVLFVLDLTAQQAQYDAGRARADAAAQTLANLQAGARPEEIEVIEAQLSKARADLALAEQSLARTQELFDRNLVSPAALDQSKAAAQSAQSAIEQLTAQLKVQRLPAREAQQAAAKASLAAAKADAASAKSALDARTVTAPADGRVERLFYSAGEFAGAGAPVVSMSGAATMKALFYVGQNERQQFTLGQKVRVTCDGCAAGLTATISRFDSEAQFTPPVIYSRDERNRLVFRTEAVLDRRDALLPGQPVTIERIE